MGALLVLAGTPELEPAAVEAIAAEIVVHPTETVDAWRDDEAGVRFLAARWASEAGIVVEPDVVLAADADLRSARSLIERYRVHGLECARGFDAPIAFALWDRRRRLLLLGTDVLSRHPLAYFWDGRVLAASTRALALLRHPRAPRQWNRTYLAHVLGDLAAPPPGETAFAGVRRLPPGGGALLEGSRFSTRQLDELDVHRAHDRAFAVHRDDLWSHLEADATAYPEASIALSGGIDSGCIAVARVRAASGARVRAFSIVSATHPELDERWRIESLVRAHPALDVRLVEAQVAPPADLGAGPLADDPWVLAPGFEASRRRLVEAAAEDGARVLVDGEGGDEIFDLAVGWADLLAVGSLGEAARQLVAARNPIPLLWRHTLVPSLPALVRPWWLARQQRKGSRAPWMKQTTAWTLALQQQERHHFHANYASRMSMFVAGPWSVAARAAERLASRASGVSRRSPLLERRVVELALRLPPALRTGPPGEKRFLRRVASEALPNMSALGGKEIALHRVLLRSATDAPFDAHFLEQNATLAHLLDREVLAATRAALTSSPTSTNDANLSAFFWILRCVRWVERVESRYHIT